MGMLLTYFGSVRAARRRLALVVVLGVVGAVFQGASVGLLLPALEIAENSDAASGSGPLWRIVSNVFDPLGIRVGLLSLLLGVLVMIVIGQSLIYAQKHIGAGMSEDFVASLRRRGYSTFMGADLSFHHTVRTGTLTNVLTQDIQRTGGAFESLMEMMSHSILLVVFAAALFLVSWSSSLTALGIVIAAGLLIQYQIRKSRRMGQEMVETFKDFHGFAAERMEAVRLVKLSNAGERDSHRYAGIVGRVASVRKSYTRRGAQIRLVLEPALAAGGIAATYMGLRLFDMSLAQMATFLYVLARIVPEAHSLNRARYNVAGFVNHFHSAMSLMREAEERTVIRGGTRPFDELTHAITLDHVSFSYNNGSSQVLDGVNPTLEAKRLTAIVGPSGVGKSTLLDHVVRLVEPGKGRVLLDGIDVKEYDLVSLRRRIALMSQDVVLFNDTVLDNIRYSCPDATEEQVIEAAVQANAHDFIRALPNGYHTLLGPRGMTISGGERQRIGLARALLPKPSVLLLDEVTSNLDSESERLIQEALFQSARERTVVIVTHRLSTIRGADKIVVLDKGRIVEEGTPAALANHDGLFRHLFELQLGGEMKTPGHIRHEG